MKSYIALSIVVLLLGCAGSKKEETNLFPEFDFQEVELRARKAEAKSEESARNVKEIETSVIQNREKLNDLEDMMHESSPARIAELEHHLALLTEAYRDLYETVAAIRVLPQIKYTPKKPQKPEGFSISKATTEFLGGKESVLYSKALEAYRGGLYPETEQILQSLLTNYPTSRFTSQAHYWTGKALKKQKRYDEALVSFKKAEEVEGSPVADAALFESARCFMVQETANDKAIELFHKLIQRYPASSYRTSAEKHLKSLEGPEKN